MTFDELLIESKTNPKYAFFLGMIYGWPLVDKNHIAAYSTYKTGPKIDSLFSKSDLDAINIRNNSAIYEFIDGMNISKADVKVSGPGENWYCSVLFECDGLDSESERGRAVIYGMIEKSLIDFTNECSKYFISGLFNARGSMDFNHSLMAIDLEKKIHPSLTRRKYITLSKLAGVFFNFNPRALQPVGATKNDQFRIPLKIFVSEYGLLFPFKMEYYLRATGATPKKHNDLFFVKYDLSTTGEYANYSMALKINNLAIDFESGKITEQELLRQRFALGLDNNDDLDILLHANPIVKEARKQTAGYACEIDARHETFVARANNLPFVEGHHLIPFHRRNDFAVNIDVVENIVALCPTCHRKIHLAVDDEKLRILDELYDKNIDGFRNAGIIIEKKDLFGFYDIYV